MTAAPISTTWDDALYSLDLKNPGGPLTTVFTPPAKCSSGLYEGSYAEDGDATGDAIRAVVYLTERSDGDCYPSGYNVTGIQGYYSPGMCPSGYSTYSYATSGSLTSARCFPT
jgi:hypothetical protein